MKQLPRNLLLIILTVSILQGCGSGSARLRVKDISGRWSGRVALDQARSCSVPANEAVDLDGAEYTLMLEPLDGEQRKLVVDQDGNQYEQYFPDGIQDGEFSVVSLTQDFTETTPTAPTSIAFMPNDGEEAAVEVRVTYNRFCTVIFTGSFVKL